MNHEPRCYPIDSGLVVSYVPAIRGVSLWVFPMRGGKDKLFKTLLNSGPKTMDELPVTKVSPQHRQDGVTRFDPSSSYRGGSTQGGGQTYGVYYIDGKHNPKTVVKKWLDVNQKTVESVGNIAIHHRISSYGQEWKEASREVLDCISPNPDGGPGQKGGTCPLCGEEYAHDLPDHLPCES